MKQPKKLTRSQKELLNKEGLDPTKWMLKDEDNSSYGFIKKDSGEIKVIFK